MPPFVCGAVGYMSYDAVRWFEAESCYAYHTINAWEFSPGGRLHMLEGVSMSTAVETPWGPSGDFERPHSGASAGPARVPSFEPCTGSRIQSGRRTSPATAIP